MWASLLLSVDLIWIDKAIFIMRLHLRCSAVICTSVCQIITMEYEMCLHLIKRLISLELGPI